METGDLVGLCASWIWRASWQASVLVLIVLAIQWLVRFKLAPAWRYGLWFVVLARLCWPVSLPSAWSIFNYARIAPSEAPTLQKLAATEKPSLADPPNDPLATPQQGNSLLSEHRGDLSRQGAIEGLPVIQLRDVLIWGWLAGAGLLASRLIWNNYRFSRQLRGRSELNNPVVKTVFDECRSLLGVRRRLTLFEVPEVESPALFGCFRLRLLLPEKMSARFSSAELRHIFLHELAHVRRRDVLVNWLTTVLQIVHWFNPILWLAFHRMRADRELACDALALAYAGEDENRSYGQTIIKLLESFDRPTAMAGMVGILEDKQQMKQRLLMIASFTARPKWSGFALAILAGLGFVALTDAQTKTGKGEREIAADLEKLGAQVRYDQSRQEKPVLSASFKGGDLLSANASVIAEIQKFDGKITYDEARSDRPIIGVAFEGNERYNYPDEKQVNDDLLRNLGRLTDLTYLNFLNDRITDEGLSHLEGLTKLRTLKLRWTSVSGTGLRHLKRARGLQELWLMGKRISDDGLTNLQHFPNLETLDLGRGDQITNSGLTNLAGLQKLRRLGFHLGSPAGDALTAEGFRHLSGLTNLETLTGIGRPGTVFDDEALAHLKNLTKLRS